MFLATTAITPTPSSQADCILGPLDPPLHPHSQDPSQDDSISSLLKDLLRLMGNTSELVPLQNNHLFASQQFQPMCFPSRLLSVHLYILQTLWDSHPVLWVVLWKSLI